MDIDRSFLNFCEKIVNKLGDVATMIITLVVYILACAISFFFKGYDLIQICLMVPSIIVLPIFVYAFSKQFYPKFLDSLQSSVKNIKTRAIVSIIIFVFILTVLLVFIDYLPPSIFAPILATILIYCVIYAMPISKEEAGADGEISGKELRQEFLHSLRTPTPVDRFIGVGDDGQRNQKKAQKRLRKLEDEKRRLLDRYSDLEDEEDNTIDDISDNWNV